MLGGINPATGSGRTGERPHVHPCR